MAKNMESHGIKLAFGEFVKAVEGETKVERIVTDKNALRCRVWLFLLLVSV